MPTLAINHGGFRRHSNRAGFPDDTYLELSRWIGLTPSTISRVMRGDIQPSPRFIAGALRVFGLGSFNELFDVVDDAVKSSESVA